MNLHQFLRLLSADTVLAIWREAAQEALNRGFLFDHEVATFNEIAMIWGEKAGKTPYLSGGASGGRHR